MTNDMTTILRQQAIDENAQYPQYAGHYDNWIAIKAMRDVKHRGLVIVSKGEYALMDPTSIEAADPETCRPSARGKTFATFYISRTKPDTYHGNICVDVAGFEMP